MTTDRTVNRTPPLWSAIVFSALACALAVSGSLMRPVWHDELYTLALARMPLSELFMALWVDSGPPLHYLICHSLYSIVGWPEGSALGTFLVRLPSVLAYSLLPWVLWRWARGHGERYFWAALLTIVWLPLLYFATEARAYALLALVNAVLWLLGPELIKRGGYRLVLFSVLAAALPMLHYAGLVSFCFLPTLALFIPRLRWRSFATVLGAAALPVLAWSPVILGAPNDSMRWVDTSAGPGRPGVVSIEVLSPAGPYPAVFEAPVNPAPKGVSIAALALLAAAGVSGGSRILRMRGEDRDRRATAIRLSIGLLPATTLGALARFGLPVYFAGRTESTVWCLVASLVAVGCLSLPRAARWVMMAPYALLGLLTVGLWLGDPSSRSAVPGVIVGRELAGVMAPADRVVVVGLWQLEVRHGLAEMSDRRIQGVSRTVEVETLPLSQSRHPGWFDLEAAVSPALIEEAREYFVDVRQQGGRVWLVWSPGLPLEQNLFPAFAGWRRDRVVDSPILVVDLLSPPKPMD